MPRLRTECYDPCDMRPRDISNLQPVDDDLPNDDQPTMVGGAALSRADRSEMTDLKSTVAGAVYDDEPTIEIAMPPSVAPQPASSEEDGPHHPFDRRSTLAHNIRGSVLVGGIDDPTLPVLLDSDDA